MALRRTKIILVDYSQTALAAILQFQNELKGPEEKSAGLIRHIILNSLQSYKKKYGPEFGELVITCDGQNCWRKEFFKYYKAGRRKAREESSLPWALIFDTINKLREDLIANFPYKVVRVDKCEADDVIAVLSEWSQDNDLVQTGLIEEPQKVLIISSDHDFFQLHRFENVRQWSPRVKKYVKAERDYMTNGHIQHIVKAGDDGIPSILNRDDIMICEERQKPVSAKRLAEFIEKGFDACRDDFERRNWHRNTTLVDFRYIPEDLKTKIVETYEQSKPVKDRMKIMNYLIQNKCRLLLDHIEDF